MKVDPDTDIVIQRFDAIGYAADPIERPGPSGKKADLWAHRSEDYLVVEVKSRIDDTPTAEQLRRESTGTIVEREGTMGRKNWLSAVVRKAANQIEDSQKLHAGLGILWFRAIPALGLDDSEQQLIDTLLGVVHGGWKCGEQWGMAPLYGADFSDFYRFPHLDAAVIEVAGDRGRLVVNPFSPRKPQLERTRLYSFMKDSVLDVEQLNPPKAFVLRGDIDRRDRHAVWQALCDQYPEYRFMFSSTFSWGAVVQIELPKAQP